MDMIRITARWTGFAGAPGYSNFFFAGGGGLISDAQQVADRVQDGLEYLGIILAGQASIALEPEAAVIDSDTGEITGYREITPGSPISGAGNGAYAGPVGAVVNWRTSDLRNGRRIRGRTFLVPLSTASFDTDGTLTDTARGQVTSFAGTLAGGDLDSEFGVWSRPIGGSGGVFASATGYSVPDMAAVLRSRRD